MSKNPLTISICEAGITGLAIAIGKQISEDFVSAYRRRDEDKLKALDEEVERSVFCNYVSMNEMWPYIKEKLKREVDENA